MDAKTLSLAALRDARDDGSAFCVWSRTRYVDIGADGRECAFESLDWIVWCDGEPCARHHALRDPITRQVDHIA